MQRCKYLLFMIMSFSKHFKSFKIKRKNKIISYTCNLCYFNAFIQIFLFNWWRKVNKQMNIQHENVEFRWKLFHIWHKSLPIWHHRMKAHYGGVNIVDTLYFFMDIMFELQLCHYNEGFSQLFCMLW